MMERLKRLMGRGVAVLLLVVVLASLSAGRTWAYVPSDDGSDLGAPAYADTSPDATSSADTSDSASAAAPADTSSAPVAEPTVAAATPVPPPVVVTATGPAPTVVASPLELKIPRIGVDARIVPVDLEADGAMGVPPGPWSVGWWDRGFLPGQLGSAVIDGHVDYVHVGPAVFWNLGNLQAGDKIQVSMPGRQVLTFVVERTAVYAADDQTPINTIFGPSDVPRLNLITCTGVFDSSSRNYNRRLVVYSKLASP